MPRSIAAGGRGAGRARRRRTSRSISPCRPWCRRCAARLGLRAATSSRRWCARARPQGRRRGRAARRRARRGSSAQLLRAAGPAGAALAALDALELPAARAAERARLVAVRRRGSAAACPRSRSPSIRSSIAASSTTPASASRFFARPAARGELGRGGRYVSGDGGEPATGFTPLYSTRAAGPARADAAPPAVPAAGNRARARRRALRAEGWVTVAGARRRPPTARRRRAGSAAAICARRPAARVRSPVEREEEPPWPMSRWSAPSGATRARARSSTGCRSAPTSWCASRAATMPATRWSSATRPTSCACCPRAWCGRASSRSSATASSSIPGRCSTRSRRCAAQGVDDHAGQSAASPTTPR